MLSWRSTFRCSRAQALVELTLALPFLIALGLGVIEFGNMINSYLVLTHLTREGANLTSREPGAKGSSTWATNVTNDLNAVIDSASPVVNTTGTGPTGPPQWRVIYSMIVWDPAANCGLMNNGTTADNYRIERSTSPSNPTWIYGGLSQSSNIGADNACASVGLPSVKDLSTTGLTLHIVEVFYDYAPSKLTPVQNFIGAFVPGIFYRKTVFADVTGG